LEELVAGKLNRRSQQRFKRIVESLENINKLAAKLRLEDLEELIRRDAIPVDGNSGGSSSSVAVARSGGKPSSSSVERAVISKMEGRPVRDPVRDQVKKIERQIITTEENLRQISESINYLKDGVEKAKGRTISDPCEICLVLPIVKTAMCFGCYSEWIEAGAPDRFRWKAYKRALTSSEGIPLVTEQPPARHPRF
jgi:predicted PP-loop superfamily ATPase